MGGWVDDRIGHVCSGWVEWWMVGVHRWVGAWVGACVGVEEAVPEHVEVS